MPLFALDAAHVVFIRSQAVHNWNIGQGIQHALHAVRRGGGEADQREADVADGGVGHQALDVGLADGGEGAQRHRRDRDR